jgi:hypothetical protein
LYNKNGRKIEKYKDKNELEKINKGEPHLVEVEKRDLQRRD